MAARAILAVSILLSILSFACDSAPSDTLVATGIVIEVDAPSLTQLNGFTLRTDDGDTLELAIAPEANTADPQEGFVPSHLREHALALTKVKVSYRQSVGQLLVIRIEDVLT